ncbi:MAG: class I SAM-dependent methyltransferase [Pseudomonadota bacterium]|nr:class I SAM-dependent methyltransferase [Pseudomonadota bacterium]
METLNTLSWQMYEFLRRMEGDWHQRFAETADPVGAAEAFGRDWKPTATDQLDALFAAMSEQMDLLPTEELRRQEAGVRMLLHPWFLLSPFCRRVVDWPLGYPGDYRAVEMVFAGREAATTPIGNVLGNYTLGTGPCEAHRGRAGWAHARIDEWLVQSGTKRPHILSFACGPEVVLRRWVQAGGVADITLADHDTHALSHAGRQLWKVIRGRGNASTVRGVEANALHMPGGDALTLLGADRPYDVVTVLGLLDYLDDAQCVAFLGSLCSALRPGGLLLVSNVSGPNRWRALMELVGGWRVVHRSPDRFLEVLGRTERLADLDLTVHSSGTNVYVSGIRS